MSGGQLTSKYTQTRLMGALLLVESDICTYIRHILDIPDSSVINLPVQGRREQQKLTSEPGGDRSLRLTAPSPHQCTSPDDIIKHFIMVKVEKTGTSSLYSVFARFILMNKLTMLMPLNMSHISWKRRGRGKGEVKSFGNMSEFQKFFWSIFTAVNFWNRGAIYILFLSLLRYDIKHIC